MIQEYTQGQLTEKLRRGCLVGEVFDEHGKFLRRVMGKNGATNVGLDYDLSVAYAGGSQQALWYLGLINNSPAPNLQVTDTMAVHAGWAEATTYAEAARQQWVPGSVSGQSVTNPVSAAFSINGSVTLYGAFAVSNSTKGGTSGILTATGAFGSPQVMSSGQTFRLTWIISQAGA